MHQALSITASFTCAVNCNTLIFSRVFRECLNNKQGICVIFFKGLVTNVRCYLLSILEERFTYACYVSKLKTIFMKKSLIQKIHQILVTLPYHSHNKSIKTDSCCCVYHFFPIEDTVGLTLNPETCLIRFCGFPQLFQGNTRRAPSSMICLSNLFFQISVNMKCLSSDVFCNYTATNFHFFLNYNVTAAIIL